MTKKLSKVLTNSGLTVSSSSALPTGNRTKPTVKQLKLYIDKELDEITAGKKEFTAYMVTTVLRVKYPMVEIVHEDVRHYVHNKMQQYDKWNKSQWIYDSANKDYNGEQAMTYFPVLQTVQGYIAQPKVQVTVTKEPKKKDPDPIRTTVNTNLALPRPNQVKIDWGDD